MLSKQKLVDYLCQEGISTPDKAKLSQFREKAQGCTTGKTQNLPDKAKLSRFRDDCTSSTEYMPDKAKLSQFRDDCISSTEHLPEKVKPANLPSHSRSNHSEHENMPRLARVLKFLLAQQVHYHIYEPVGNLSHQVAGNQISNLIQEEESSK